MPLRWSLLLSTALLLYSLPVTAANLLEVYQRALQHDPQIREADAIRRARLESKPQAWSALLPSIFASAEAGRDEFSEDVRSRNSSTATSTDTDLDFIDYRLRLSQTLLRWDQWLELRRADVAVAQAEADFRAAEQNLILRTAQRYFDVLAAQDAVDAAVATLEAVERQFVQSERRFQVGLGASIDVQEARAARDATAAAVIAVRRTLSSSRALLNELTRDPFLALAAPAENMPLEPPWPHDPEQWVGIALESNLSLVSSRFSVDLAREDVRIARSEHLPTLDLVLVGDGADNRRTRTVTDSNGHVETRDNIDNSGRAIFLQLNVPIYSGHGTRSRVRESSYLHEAAQERLSRAFIETESTARDAYLGVLSGISQVKALRQSVESSRAALQATEAGFDVGTRTTVDVLDARRRLLDAQTNYSRGRYDYIMSRIQLKLAAGTLSRAEIEDVSSWMQ